MKILKSKAAAAQQEDHWIPLSDLMTGLMMMFMLVAIIFMLQSQEETKKAQTSEIDAKASAENANKDKQRVQNIANVYADMQTKLYVTLLHEFQNDMKDWGATLDKKSLTIRFYGPNVLFDNGRTDITPSFKRILDDFFPRYVRILTADEFRPAIEEIRIEGHTSSAGRGLGVEDAYFYNMELSQARTRVTLRYVLSLPEIRQSDQLSWLRGRLTANGLSSSRLQLRSNGSEDDVASRRVEFRIRTNAEERISEILETVKP